MRASRSGSDVRLAVDRRDDVAAGARRRAAAGRPERSRAIGASRQRHVGHHVADDLDPPGDALAARASPPSARRAAAGAARPRRPRSRLRSSGIERSPLRSPASTCATGTPGATAARAPASGRVRVAVDEHPVRAARARSPSAIAGPHRLRIGACGRLEPVRRARGARARRRRPARAPGPSAGPVWSDDLVDRRPSRSATETRRGLDELRPVADDGEDPHRSHCRRRRRRRTPDPLPARPERATLVPAGR